MSYDGFDTASANLGGDDGKVAAPTQSSTQKAASHLVRQGRITCGVEDREVRGPPSRTSSPPPSQGLKLGGAQETGPATEMVRSEGRQDGRGARVEGRSRCGRGTRGEGQGRRLAAVHAAFIWRGKRHAEQRTRPLLYALRTVGSWGTRCGSKGTARWLL